MNTSEKIREFSVSKNKYYFRAVLEGSEILFEFLNLKDRLDHHEFYEGKFDLTCLKKTPEDKKLAQKILKEFEQGSMFRLNNVSNEVLLVMKCGPEKMEKSIRKVPLKMTEVPLEKLHSLDLIRINDNLKRLENRYQGRFKTLYNKLYYIKEKIQREKNELRCYMHEKEENSKKKKSDSYISEDSIMETQSFLCDSEGISKHYSTDESKSVVAYPKSEQKVSISERVLANSKVNEELLWHIPINNENFNISGKLISYSGDNKWNQLVLKRAFRLSKLDKDIEFRWKIHKTKRRKIYFGLVAEEFIDKESSIAENLERSYAIAYGGSSNSIRAYEKIESLGHGFKQGDIVTLRIMPKVQAALWKANNVVHADCVLTFLMKFKLYPTVELYDKDDCVELLD